jgi:hypothetical protein
MKHVAHLLLITAGCLPADDRPEPGSVFVTVEPSQATKEGFTTADGWTVTFDRFLTAVGDVNVHSAEGGSCIDYNDPHYQWLIDFTVAGREKVALVYALGDCSVEFSVRPPSDDDTLLGPGGSEQDIVSMRVRASDDYSEDERIAVLVRGHAERAGISKRFDWAFRHRYELTDCEHPSGAGFVSDIVLQGGDALGLDIIVRGEELFRQLNQDDAPLQFDRMAAADADGDGSVSLTELAEVDGPPELDVEELKSELPVEAAPAEDEQPSMADLVYGLLLPRIARFAGGGECEVELDAGW